MKPTTLLAARKARGWTQEELEDASGVEQTVISRLERGENRSPRYDTVRKLESALKLKPGSLVFGDEAVEVEASR